jgi:hypothetical protein
MNRAEFRAAFDRLVRARGAAYVEARTPLVAAGASIVEWLREEGRSRDTWRAMDALTVLLWIEEPRRVLACTRVLDRTLRVPRHRPNIEEEDRVNLLIAAGPLLTPRLLEGLFRSEEYDAIESYLAAQTLKGLRDPRSQEPLRHVIGDPTQTMQRRVRAAQILWIAFSDARTLAFAEAIAADDQTPPSERAWSLEFLAERGERHILPLVRSLLESPQLDISIGLGCLHAIQVLRDVESARLLERLIIRTAISEEIRDEMPHLIATLIGVDALPMLRRRAAEDPSESVREESRRAVIELERSARPWGQ